MLMDGRVIPQLKQINTDFCAESAEFPHGHRLYPSNAGTGVRQDGCTGYLTVRQALVHSFARDSFKPVLVPACTFKRVLRPFRPRTRTRGACELSYAIPIHNVEINYRSQR